MLDLNHIELAEPEDIASGLVQWINFFKASTWKEVLHMATQNESIAKAASTMHSLYQNHYVYDECWQREEHERIECSLIHQNRMQLLTQLSALYSILTQENRLDDYNRALNDSDFLDQLLKKYNLTKNA